MRVYVLWEERGGYTSRQPGWVHRVGGNLSEVGVQALVGEGDNRVYVLHLDEESGELTVEERTG